jgi:branched-chain amino acid transport system permease protein
MIAGAAGGLLLYVSQVRWIFGKANFDLRIIILTMAFSTIVVDLINNLIGAKILRQPFQVEGRFDLGALSIGYQTLLVVCCSALMVLLLQLVVHKTNLGRLIRAVSQDITAARLNGVPVQAVILQVMVLAGIISGASGVLLTSTTTVYPGAGFDPLLKALIVCVLGGLGSIPGALAASFALAGLETTVQYTLGVKWGFPVSLLVVVLVLVYRPTGLFGRQELERN